MWPFVFLGAINAFLAVTAGAFGAHGLKARLAPDLMEVFETAARYHMYHALGLLLVGGLANERPSAAFTACGWFMVVGILLFCGSLYLLAFTGLRWLGAVTPIGGLAFLFAWGLLVWGSIKPL